MHQGFRFVANLKPYTVRRGSGNRRFDSYLLSVDYVDEFRDLALEVAADGAAVCADNGNVDLIRSFVTLHAPAARALEAERRGLENSPMPESLRDRYRSLTNTIRASAEASSTDTQVVATVRAQLAMNPTYLVAMEDLTIATMTSLGLAPNHAGLGDAFYRASAKRAVDFAIATASGKYGDCRATPFAVLHAPDYDSARIAGVVAGKAGTIGIATGLAGALQDAGYVDHVIENGRTIPFGRAVPAPYVRVAQIVSGLHEGFVEASGRRPAFHALGAGSPILLPLLAALGDGRTYTATDSTAPIIDGWSGPTISLYVDDPAPLKYKGHRIVEEWLRNGREWGCSCPYCRAFDRAYPPRLDDAIRWWNAQGKPRLTAESVRSSSPLSTWLPLFGNAEDPGLRLTGAMARVGHNHWVLQRLETAARNHSESQEQLFAWVDEIVAAYLASAADPPWKLAVEEAWRIIRRAAESTRRATSTPLPSL